VQAVAFTGGEAHTRKPPGVIATQCPPAQSRSVWQSPSGTPPSIPPEDEDEALPLEDDEPDALPLEDDGPDVLPLEDDELDEVVGADPPDPFGAVVVDTVMPVSPPLPPSPEPP
jgi:hypothetical protein